MHDENNQIDTAATIESSSYCLLACWTMALNGVGHGAPLTPQLSTCSHIADYVRAVVAHEGPGEVPTLGCFFAASTSLG
jgi:hypothetical protein